MAMLLTIVGGLIPIAIIAYFVSFALKGKPPIVRHGYSIGFATVAAICLGAFGNAVALPPSAMDWANATIVYMSSGLMYFSIRASISSMQKKKAEEETTSSG
jgi:hypothetical protein